MGPFFLLHAPGAAKSTDREANGSQETRTGSHQAANGRKKTALRRFLARGRRNYFFSSTAGAAAAASAAGAAAAASAAGAAGAAASAGAAAGASTAGAGAGAASSFLPQADRAAAAIRAAITRVLFIFRSKKICQDDHGGVRRHHPEMTTGVTFAALTIAHQRASSLSMIKPKPRRDNPDRLFFVANCQQRPGTPPGSATAAPQVGCTCSQPATNHSPSNALAPLLAPRTRRASRRRSSARRRISSASLPAAR